MVERFSVDADMETGPERKETPTVDGRRVTSARVLGGFGHGSITGVAQPEFVDLSEVTDQERAEDEAQAALARTFIPGGEA